MFSKLKQNPWFYEGSNILNYWCKYRFIIINFNDEYKNSINEKKEINKNNLLFLIKKKLNEEGDKLKMEKNIIHSQYLMINSFWYGKGNKKDKNFIFWTNKWTKEILNQNYFYYQFSNMLLE